MQKPAMEMLETAAVAGAIQLATRAGAAVADGAGKASSSVSKMMSGRNLVSIANVGRVEPIVLLDSDCINVDYISDVMQSVHAIFSGYYLQAVHMINEVGSVSIAERLGPLNPGHGFAYESIKIEASKRFKLRVATEDNTGAAAGTATPPPKPPKLRHGVDIDTYKDQAASANLSVGKLYNVSLTSGGHEVSVPIAVRLMVNVMPSRLLSELFTYRDAFDTNMKERWHAYRAGQLDFFKDLVLCNDIIDKYRRMAIRDKTGLGAKILDREASNVMRALSGKDSFSTASNIAVISNDTLGMIENELGGRFANSKVRRSIFENSNLMLLVVIDKQFERVTIYTRDIDAHTTLSIKDIKASNKSSGPDVTEIMRAYLMGSSPSHI